MHNLTRHGFLVTGYLPGMEHKINPRAVTTDGQGHLFVCDDYNDCLQMFSTDGSYLGAVLRQGAQGFGRPFRARWSGDTDSLVVAHVKDENCHISVISVNTDPVVGPENK